MGYYRAGFDCYGIDNDPKPLRHYPFPYICMDALEAMDRLLKGEGLTFSNGETLYLKDFAAFHASPPCQGYAVTVSIPNRDFSKYPKLIEPTADRLVETGKLYVIENSTQAPLENPLILCGSMFGLPTRRHRKFEINPPMYFPPYTCNHSGRVKSPGNGKSMNIYVKDSDDCNVTVAGHLFSLRAGSRGLGIGWMNRDELAEAIPPAYTEYIGKYLMQAITR